MRVLLDRPFVALAVCLILGILGASFLEWYFLIGLIGVVPFFFVRFNGINFILSNKIEKSIIICCVVLYILGGIEYLYMSYSNISSFDGFWDNLVAVKGYIRMTDEDKNSGDILYKMRVESLYCGESSYDKKANILVSVPKYLNAIKLKIGEYTIITGKLSRPATRRNPGGFDYEEYLFENGIQATMSANNVLSLEARKVSVGLCMNRIGKMLRDNIINTIGSCVYEEQAAVLKGMLIGYKDDIPKQLEENFKNAGISHIMAVSGANVAFIVMPMLFVFNLFGIRRVLARVLVILCVGVFVFVTGLESSVVRAAIMAILFLTAQIFMREPDMLTNISIASILIVVFNPYCVFGIGFQLSFVATIALITVYDKVKEILYKFITNKWITNGLAATLSAQMAVLPIISWYFNQISLISLLTNLLILPIVGLVSITGMFLVAIGNFSIALAHPIGRIAAWLVSFILRISEMPAYVPYSVIKVPTPSIYVVLAYYLVFISMFYLPKNEKKYVALAALTMVCIFALYTFMPKDMKVIFMDVGEGDAILIRTCTGKTVLIDGGGGYRNSNVGEMVVEPVLLNQGTRKLDIVMATHPHSDHMMGLVPVISDFGVGKIIIPACSNPSLFDPMLSKAAKMRVPVEVFERGDCIQLDECTCVNCLYPFRSETNATKHDCLVLKLVYKNTSILLTGDIEMKVERRLLESGVDIRADILKVAHHGSKFSSSSEFINKVNPNVAVISVGKNNFGHPSSDVIQRLAGRAVFRTDLSGAVTITSNGKNIKVSEFVTQSK